MSALSDEILRAVATTAAKLRVVQASFADEKPEKRAEFLEDALHQAAQQVVADQRPGFLAALKKEFPSGFKAAPVIAAAAAPAKAESAEELADKLIRATANLHGDERKAIILRLQKGGLTVQQSEKRGDDQRSMPSSGQGGANPMPDKAQQALQFLMKKLEIADLDITRLVKLMLWLVEYAGANDNIIWNTWRLIAPKSTVRRPSELRKEMVLYLSGDRTLTGTRVEYAMETQRRVLAGIIAATSKLGGALANGPLRKFRIEEIKALASQDGGGLLASMDARCWNRYQQLAADLDEEGLEHAVKEALSATAEKLVGT